MQNQYRIGNWLSVDFAKNIIGIGKIQNSHIGTPLIKRVKLDTTSGIFLCYHWIIYSIYLFQWH